MKSKQKTMGTVVLMLIIVFAVAIGFWRIMEDKREQSQEQEFVESSNNKEVNAVLKKDFDVNYPSTPREVLKNYSRIISCVYNYDDLSDGELTALTEQMRKLFDEELLASNPLDTQLEDLKADIDEYQKANRTISNYVIDKDSTIVEKKIKERVCVNVNVSYLLHEGKGYAKTYQQFLLRKNDKNQWKILGWKLNEEENSSKEEE